MMTDTTAAPFDQDLYDKVMDQFPAYDHAELPTAFDVWEGAANIAACIVGQRQPASGTIPYDQLDQDLVERFKAEANEWAADNGYLVLDSEADDISHRMASIVAARAQEDGSIESQLVLIEMLPKATLLEVIADQIEQEALAARNRPRVVCLCGSTRFMDTFHEANRRLSLEGKIVLTVEIVTYDGATDPQRADPDQKAMLDELHLRKIDLADMVLILNVGGYIGESTAKELAYARSIGKPVTFWEPEVQS